MSPVEKYQVIGFYLDNQPVCKECATSEEETSAVEEDFICEDDSEEHPIFCKRCRKGIRQFRLPKRLSTHSDPQTGPDSDGLGFWYAGGFAVGSVPEVNGPEAREVPAFAPTKHEIVQIAKYWLDRLLENRITFFLTGATGGSEARVNIYAKRRAYRVSEFLSEQEFDDLIADAERRLKNKYEINDTDWNIYKSGSQEDRDQFQEKLLRKLETDELLETDSKKEK